MLFLAASRCGWGTGNVGLMKYLYNWRMLAQCDCCDCSITHDHHNARITLKWSCYAVGDQAPGWIIWTQLGGAWPTKFAPNDPTGALVPQGPGPWPLGAWSGHGPPRVAIGEAGGRLFRGPGWRNPPVIVITNPTPRPSGGFTNHEPDCCVISSVNRFCLRHVVWAICLCPVPFI